MRVKSKKKLVLISIVSLLFLVACGRKEEIGFTSSTMKIPEITDEFALEVLSVHDKNLYFSNNLGEKSLFRSSRVYKTDSKMNTSVVLEYEPSYLMSFVALNDVNYYIFYDGNEFTQNNSKSPFQIAIQRDNEEIETVYQGSIGLDILAPQLQVYQGKVYALIINEKTIGIGEFEHALSLYNVTDNIEMQISRDKFKLSDEKTYITELYPHGIQINYPDDYLVFSTNVYDEEKDKWRGKLFIFDGVELKFHIYDDIQVDYVMSCGQQIVFNDMSTTKMYLVNVDNLQSPEEIGYADRLMTYSVAGNRLYYTKDPGIYDGENTVHVLTFNQDDYEKSLFKHEFGSDGARFESMRSGNGYLVIMRDMEGKITEVSTLSGNQE